MLFTIQSNQELLCSSVNLCAKQIPVFLQEHSCGCSPLEKLLLRAGPKSSLRNTRATRSEAQRTRNGARRGRRHGGREPRNVPRGTEEQWFIWISSFCQAIYFGFTRDRISWKFGGAETTRLSPPVVRPPPPDPGRQILGEGSSWSKPGIGSLLIYIYLLVSIFIFDLYVSCLASVQVLRGRDRSECSCGNTRRTGITVLDDSWRNGLDGKSLGSAASFRPHPLRDSLTEKCSLRNNWSENLGSHSAPGESRERLQSAAQGASWCFCVLPVCEVKRNVPAGTLWKTVNSRTRPVKRNLRTASWLYFPHSLTRRPALGLVDHKSPIDHAYVSHSYHLDSGCSGYCENAGVGERDRDWG